MCLLVKVKQMMKVWKIHRSKNTIHMNVWSGGWKRMKETTRIRKIYMSKMKLQVDRKIVR